MATKKSASEEKENSLSLAYSLLKLLLKFHQLALQFKNWYDDYRGVKSAPPNFYNRMIKKFQKFTKICEDIHDLFK